MKYLCILVIAISLAPATNAQKAHVGIFGGVAAYGGDLTSSIFPKKVTNGAIGFTFNYELNSFLSLRTGLTYAVLGGADRYSDDPQLVARNLSFETSILELSAVCEYSPFDLQQSRLSPYGFAGLALFKFNPYAYDPNGNKIFLQPLSTEGQGIKGYPDRKPYSLTQVAVPFGAGVKFALTEEMRISVEAGLRKLFTEYLDDVSTNYIDYETLRAARGQLGVDMAYRGDELHGGIGNSILPYPGEGAQRGNPDSKDFYYFTGIHFTYRLGSIPKKQTGCPVNVY